MSLFEITLVLLAIAVVLLQIARQLRVPYPAMLSVSNARVGAFVSWFRMRGLVTLATAFVLPENFPGRDVIVLSACLFVLGTFVL